MKQIPNLFTLLNLLFGCLAIIVILQNGIVIQYNEEGSQFVSIPEKIWLASAFIAAAALVDFLDGFVARLFNATSEMGKQLDSLADVVSFGVAPSLIIYQFLRLSYAREEDGIEVSLVWLLPALAVALAAAYRLAKFNIESSGEYYFKGMPTPAVGILVASLPVIYWNTDDATIITLLLNKWFLYALVIILCWLMLSNLKLMALKFRDYTLAGNLPKVLLVGLSVLLLILFKWIAIPFIFILYILLSLIFKNRL